MILLPDHPTQHAPTSTPRILWRAALPAESDARWLAQSRSADKIFVTLRTIPPFAQSPSDPRYPDPDEDPVVAVNRLQALRSPGTNAAPISSALKPCMRGPGIAYSTAPARNLLKR